MAESTQQVEKTRSEADTAAAKQTSARRANPHLQPLEDRPLRHVHHGQTGAMWAATMIVLVAFVVGGIAMVLGPNWPLFVIACVIGALGIVVGLVLQALGFGIYEKK